MSSRSGFVRLAAGSIVGAIAGVLAFAMLFTFPLVMVLFCLLWGTQHLIGRIDGSAQVAWNMIVIFSMLGACAFGAVLGLIVGGGVGARIAAGTSLSGSLARSRVLGGLASRVPCIRSRLAV